MEEFIDFLTIMGAMLGIAGIVWLWLKLSSAFDLWFLRKFGISLRIRRSPKTEIQTLFRGNTKDQDQI